MRIISRLLTRSKLLHHIPCGDVSASLEDCPYGEVDAPPIIFNSSRLPTLPIELWRRIISLVCRLPGTLNTELTDPFARGNPLSLTALEITANFCDKCNLQLVCRAWRAIAVEFTYERLAVCCHGHAAPLVKTLQKSKTQDLKLRGRGWWVKELELTKGSCSKEPDENEDHKFNLDILAILQCTPNLAIYINNNGFGKTLGKFTHPTLMQTLGSVCGQSLRRLEWSASESPRWKDLEALLPQTPALHTLCVLHVIHPAEPDTVDKDNQPPVFLRHLHTLSLGPFPTPLGVKIPAWDSILSFFMRSESDLQLPALSFLSLTPVNIIYPFSPTERFFTLYGSQLRSLRTSDLTPRDEYDTEIIASGCANTSLETMLTLSPGLHSLVVNPIQPITYPSAHPSLERIAMFPPSEHPVSVPLRLYAQQIEQPLDKFSMQLITGNFPRLKVIRLRDVGPFQFLGKSSDWLEHWRKDWIEKGIRFENRNGLSFTFAMVDMMEMMPDF